MTAVDDDQPHSLNHGSFLPTRRNTPSEAGKVIGKRLRSKADASGLTQAYSIAIRFNNELYVPSFSRQKKIQPRQPFNDMKYLHTLGD